MTLRRLIQHLQDFYLLCLRTVWALFRKPFYVKDTIVLMDQAGPGSFPIVFLVSFFIGMALSLQISKELGSFGLTIYAGKIVGISIIREIGPVAAAFSYAGRMGSGMASELGSMVLGHQVDMLRVFGTDPVKRLVTPRVVSSVIMLPALTIIGDAVALLGGYYVSTLIGSQSGSFYWGQIRSILIFDNIFPGVIKPFLFGFVITCISCYMGLTTTGGSRGLSRSTTSAVVLSIIFVIISDFLITRALMLILH